jgi:hypothetical protein
MLANMRKGHDGVTTYCGEAHIKLTDEENSHESHGAMFSNCVVVDLELSVYDDLEKLLNYTDLSHWLAKWAI